MIQVENVTKKYGSFIAVNNLNFKINSGEIVGLLGPNGAGKSTTMNMITGFIEPTEGTIVIDGKDILKSGKEAKKQIGYMPENIPLYLDLTVREFVKFMAGRAFTMIVEWGGCALLFLTPIPQMISKMSMTVIVIILNFFISKFFAFKKK